MLRLLSRVERDLGAEIRVADLFDPTPAARAALVRGRPEGGREPGAPLVRLAGAEESPAIFWVHPVGGEVVCYLDLARRLADDLAVYGLRVTTPGGGRGLPSIPEMARATSTSSPPAARRSVPARRLDSRGLYRLRDGQRAAGGR